VNSFQLNVVTFIFVFNYKGKPYFQTYYMLLSKFYELFRGKFFSDDVVNSVMYKNSWKAELLTGVIVRP